MPLLPLTGAALSAGEPYGRASSPSPFVPQQNTLLAAPASWLSTTAHVAAAAAATRSTPVAGNPSTITGLGPASAVVSPSVFS